jgi:NAD(P)-dependent dehydrogenase (short-subunit alcohol dehydrogenase family)
MTRLADKVAFITGSASGIGRATATRFAQEGACVAIVDENGEGARETADQIAEIGGRAVVKVLDVTDSAAVGAAVEETVGEFGGLDVVINNAGIDIFGGVEDLSEPDWDRELEVNLKSAFIVSKAAWPHLKAGGGGAVINTGSVAGLRGIADNVGYCVSKAGIIMLTKCLALSGAPDNVRVNCICPGFTATGMIEGYFADQQDPEEARRLALGLHPLGRFGKPRDIADGFVFLASDEAEWVTGSTVTIDGGLTCGM